MHLIGRYIELPSSIVYHQGLKIALARSQRLPFLTAGLPSFVTRKARRTSAYKIYPPINFKYIDEMMIFLYKSKFPMINIAIIITITNQNHFLLWSDIFIFGTIHYLGQGISVLINKACFESFPFRQKFFIFVCQTT